MSDQVEGHFEVWGLMETEIIRSAGWARSSLFASKRSTYPEPHAQGINDEDDTTDDRPDTYAQEN